MFLGNPSLPISISSEKAKELLEQGLKARNWKDFSVESVKLLLVPYYFFEYSTYSEKEKHGERIVSNVERGQLVFDPEISELIEGIAAFLPQKEKMLHSIEEEKFELRKPKLDSKSAQKVARLKAAEMLKKPLEKVQVIETRPFFAPLWELQAKVGKQELLFHVSGSDGTILEEDSIPFREKTAGEITSETLEELKDPKKWLQYTKELIEMAARASKNVGKAGIFASIKMNRNRLLIIALVIIIIVILLLP